MQTEVASSSPGNGPRILAVVDAAAPFLWMALATLAIAAFFWPGQMNADTLSEIAQATNFQGTNNYTNQHAPVLQWLWAPFYSLGFEAGFVLLAQIFSFMAGSYLLLRALLERLGAAVASVIIVASPIAVGMFALVGRDTWFISAVILGSGLVSEAYRNFGRRRHLLEVAAAASFFLALATRQNAAPAVLVGVAFLIWPYALRFGSVARRSQPAQVAVAVAAAGMLTIVGMGAQQVWKSAIGVTNIYPASHLYIYDLAALSVKENELLVPAEVMRTPTLPALTARMDYDVSTGLALAPDSPIRFPFTKASNAALGSAWREAIVKHPIDYLRVRAHAYLRQIGVTRQAMWVWHPYIDSNPFGYRTRFTALNRRAAQYIGLASNDSNDGYFFFAPFLWLIVSLAGAIVFLRPSRPVGQMMIGGIGLGTILYQSGLFLGTMGTNFRFEFPTVVTSMIVAVALGRLAWDWLRERREGVQGSSA